MSRARVRILAAGALAALALIPVPGADAAVTGQITGLGGKCVDVAEANIRQRHRRPALGLQRHRGPALDRR